MRCPVCATDTELTMTERQGVEIDYCPKCRGVWLDRGELDKIVELSTGQGQIRANENQDYRRREERDDDRDDDLDDDRRDDRGDRRGGGQPRRRRESFLGDLFDF